MTPFFFNYSMSIIKKKKKKKKKKPLAFIHYTYERAWENIYRIRPNNHTVRAYLFIDLFCFVLFCFVLFSKFMGKFVVIYVPTYMKGTL